MKDPKCHSLLKRLLSRRTVAVAAICSEAGSLGGVLAHLGRGRHCSTKGVANAGSHSGAIRTPAYLYGDLSPTAPASH